MPDYFTLAEFRALPDMADSSTYSDTRVDEAAAHITGIVEREVGTAFISRTVTAEKHDGGTDAIVLHKPHPISVTSATEDGTAVTDTLSIVSGVLRRFSSSTSFTPIWWTNGIGNVSVTYTHGYSTAAPSDIKEAVMRGTRAYLLETSEKSGVLDRRSSVTNDLGGTTSYVLAGQDQPTGYPQVDAVILGWKSRIDLYGFA